MKPIVTVFGVGILAVATAIAFKKKKTTLLDQELVLQMGSRGQEVANLQTLMGIVADGIFGPITEAKLVKLKGVKKTTLKQFLSSPTINQNILKIGTAVMAKLKLGTPIYNAIEKADTSYYSTFEKVKVIPYGQEIGKIRSVNPAGNWYSVYYTDVLFGQKVGFVKATDVDKF